VPLLELDRVTRRFGGVVALDEVSLSVEGGVIAGLIGPNGAGKTTAFNVITRLYAPDSGSLRFDGTDLLSVPAHRIVGLGIARTFQNLALFQLMSVLENVLLGGHSRSDLRSESAARAGALETLDYLGLGPLARRPAAGLPFGTLKRIELARALLAKPRLLLLDEPMAGMGPEESQRVIELLKSLKGAHTMLLVEHDMDAVFALADRISVMVYGRLIATGSPEEIRHNAEVREAYLGEDITA
jgi:branched-chain amino acid transport system ATP-binding protein